MASRWLAPWRVLVLGLGVAVPLTGVILVSTLAPPTVLHWQPPQPAVTAARFREARAALDAGRLAEAQALLEALRGEDALDPLIHATLGELHRKAGRRLQALAATRMAVSLAPDFPEAWYNLACDEAQLGRKDDAIRSLAKAVEAGFSARELARRDPDLSNLQADERLLTWLEGASRVPLSSRAAWLLWDPPQPRPGEPFSLVLEAVTLGRPLEEPTPSLSVEFLGSPELPLAPLQVEERLVSVREASARHRWRVSWQLKAPDIFQGRPGPWEVQIDGVSVPLESLPLRVAQQGEGTPFAPAPSVKAQGQAQALVRTRGFFRFPDEWLMGLGPGVHARVWAGESGFPGEVLQVAVVPAPAPGTALSVSLPGGGRPTVTYDIQAESGLDVPSRRMQVIALPPDYLSLVQKSPLTVQAGGASATLLAHRAVPPPRASRKAAPAVPAPAAGAQALPSPSPVPPASGSGTPHP